MQQIPHLHLLYAPSCKVVAHPFPDFTKEIRASFGNASQNLLLLMQSSKIWILCKRLLFWGFGFFFVSFFFFLRDSVIFAQGAPCTLRSTLDGGLSSFSQSLQPACSLHAGAWESAVLRNPGHLCEMVAGGAGAPGRVPGGAAGPCVLPPPDAHQ